MTGSTVLVLHEPELPEVGLRCAVFGSFIWRLRLLGGQDTELVSAPANPGQALARLARMAGLVSQVNELRYVASRSARERVASEEDGTWPKSVASRQRRMMRRSQGSIVRCPLDRTEGAAGEEAMSVEAFVTDWTGMPGSCALAVHPAHPLSTGLAPDEHASFTGRHCRHPLTGDLLPIWVADWVKPEFGTGAVLINPAHNRADLEFARRVGLPIQFALAPEDHDGSPGSWLTPPYIKSGVAIRTGGVTDGLPFDRASTVYFAKVNEWGLAEQYIDNGMGAFTVATIAKTGPTEVPWDHRRRTVAAFGEQGDSARLATSPVLAGVEERVREADVLTVVLPSTRVENDLLALRLLLAEPNIEPAVKNSPEVIVVGNVLPVPGVTSDAALCLALLVNAGPLDTLALKPQQIEPCERFLKVHESLAAAEPVAGEAVSPDVAKAAAQIKGQLVRQDPKQAFTQLYRLQKSIAKTESLGEQDLLRYLTLAHVLAGTDTPYAVETMVAAWQQI